MSETIIEGRDEKTGRFLPGNSGNGGRPKGSRNKLGEAFIADVFEEWQKSGADALKRMAQDDPTSFVRVVAGVLPKEIDASVTVTVEQFQRAETYLQAFRLARDFIGAEDKPLLIEAHDE